MQIYLIPASNKALRQVQRSGAVKQILEIMISIIEFPTILPAFSSFFSPRLRLTKAHAPSPIITDIARSVTVSGNTTVFAAFPNEPRYAAFAMKI